MSMGNQHTTKDASQQIELVRNVCLSPMLPTAVPDVEVGNLDWRWMTNFAIRHGLAPLFRRGLGMTNKNILNLNAQEEAAGFNAQWKIDREQLNLLRDSYLSTLQHNMKIQAALKELDDSLSGTEIRCMVWKGAALMYDVYPDLGLRPMDDIDLLVSQQNLEQFKRILERLGFVPRPLYPLTWHRLDMVMDIHLDVVHGDRISGRLKALPITADILFQKARPLSDFRQLVTTAPHDSLICLAAHALKHGFSRDIWLMDAIFLMTQFPETISPPEKLIQRAFDLQASFPLYILFSILQRWQQNLDLKFIGRLRPKRFGLIPRLFIESYATSKLIPHSGELFYLLMMTSYRQKIAFLLETMFPSRQVMQQLFPDRSLSPHWLYYPHRIVGLVAMGMKTLNALNRLSKRYEEKINT